MINHIVLFEPLMPTNTGNITKACVGTETVLDLIEPLGFQSDNKKIKRAGLNCWDKIEIHKHDDLKAFLDIPSPNDEMYLISKFSSKSYTDIDYTDNNKNYYFVFSKETTGSPETFMGEYYDRSSHVPTSDHIRTYNLPNPVAVVTMEALRQQGFPKLEESRHYENDKLKDDYNRHERYERDLGDE